MFFYQHGMTIANRANPSKQSNREYTQFSIILKYTKSRQDGHRIGMISFHARVKQVSFMPSSQYAYTQHAGLTIIIVSTLTFLSLIQSEILHQLFNVRKAHSNTLTRVAEHRSRYTPSPIRLFNVPN